MQRLYPANDQPKNVRTELRDLYDCCSENPVHLLILKILYGHTPPERSRRAFRLRSTTIIPNKHVQTRLITSLPSNDQPKNIRTRLRDFRIFGIVKTSEQDFRDYCSDNPAHLLILKILCGHTPPERSRRAFRLRSTTIIPNEHVQTRLIASLPSKTHILYFLYRRCIATSLPSKTTNRKISEQDYGILRL